MVLPHQEILNLCNISAGAPDDTETDTGPIIACKKANVRSAGYDLRLGLEYYLPDQKEGGTDSVEVKKLDPQLGACISIPPNRVVIVAIRESLNLPNYLVGHLSLKLDLLLKGLMMSSQSQIDAGYKGSIFALLYNLSDRPVEISYLDSILRLELETLIESTDAPYHGAYRQTPLAQSLRSPIGSSLYALAKDYDSIKGEVNKASWRTGLITGAIALFLTLVPAYFTYLGPLPNRITKLEESTNVQGLSKDLQSLTKALEKEPEEKKVLLDRIEELNKRIQTLESKKK